MNKQELIERIEDFPCEASLVTEMIRINKNTLLGWVKELDEPQPLKLKDVIKRIEGFYLGTQKVWLDEILNELGSDYGLMKYKDGYEQGRFDGAIEHEKVTVPQFVADYIKYTKETEWDLQEAMDNIAYEDNKYLRKWFNDNIETFARAWLDGYTVEKEQRYYVRFKFIEDSYSYLTLIKHLNAWTLTNIKLDKKFRSEHTKKQLEDANFGWVFDCPGIEIEEVE